MPLEIWRWEHANLHPQRKKHRKVHKADLAFNLQNAIRDFLKKRTSYDVLPLSFRLIILNTDLLVKKSLNILLQNGAYIEVISIVLY